MSDSASQPLQGMSDIGPPEIALWQHIESTARSIFPLYGVSELRTPILERTKVFSRTIGNETDIVQKEMYSFNDRGGRNLTMRPEGTAGVVRYLSSLGQEAGDARVYYIGPMFRAERPQAGRKRQFHQCGVEMIGAANPVADAECIALQLQLLRAWGLSDCRLKVNTRGEADEAAQVAESLREALQAKRDELCEDCRRRFDTNILRVLDCKNEECSSIVDGLPPLTEFMRSDSRKYFDDVVERLDQLGIEYEVAPRLVRGLDYYMHTVWEISHSALGAQDSLSGGGRYSIAVGKKRMEGVGFAMGLERVIMAMQACGAADRIAAHALRLWLVSMGGVALDRNFILCQKLRQAGIACGMDLGERSMKAQMRAANRAGADFVLIRGDNEIERGVVVLKEMASGEQRELEESKVADELE